MKDIIKEKIEIAEKRVLELNGSGDIKRLSEKEKHQISSFYGEKSKNRLQTSKIIYNASNKEGSETLQPNG